MRFYPRNPTPVGLLVLVLILVVLVALIVVFSQTILASLANVDAQANTIVLIASIILPLILLGIIIYQLVLLIRERTLKRPGSHLKIRLLLFFVFVSLISSIPQALLSVSFINATIGFWLQAGIEEGLRGALDISLEYYRGLVDNLDRFNSSRAMSSLLRDMRLDPDRMWRNIQDANSSVHSVQIFDEEGREVIFRGNQNSRVEFSSLNKVSGNLPKEDREALSILRNITSHNLFGRVYYSIVGTILTEGFDAKARQLTESLENFSQLNRYRRLFRIVLVVFYLIFSFPIFLLSILVSFLLTDEISRPIANLEEATRRVAEGDFSFRVLTRSEDELSGLVSSFNRMLAELSHSRKKLIQAEKINAWQDIAQRLAHEIKNPLTPIKLSAQRILKVYGKNPETIDQILEPAISAIIQEVDNLNQLLQEFREFARLPGPNLEEMNIGQIVKEVAEVYQHLSRTIHFDFSHLDEIILRADKKQMKQVFANLFKNAVTAMPAGGEIRVSTDIVKKENSNYCRIRVRDNGRGIDENTRTFVFTPYFTTKKDGVGLGLAIVERIIFDHDGSIHFETEVGVGTTFFIDLPMEMRKL